MNLGLKVDHARPCDIASEPLDGAINGLVDNMRPVFAPLPVRLLLRSWRLWRQRQSPLLPQRIRHVSMLQYKRFLTLLILDDAGEQIRQELVQHLAR